MIDIWEGTMSGNEMQMFDRGVQNCAVGGHSTWQAGAFKGQRNWRFDPHTLALIGPTILTSQPLMCVNMRFGLRPGCVSLTRKFTWTSIANIGDRSSWISFSLGQHLCFKRLLASVCRCCHVLPPNQCRLLPMKPRWYLAIRPIP